MDTQPLDHSFHSADVPNLHTDLHTHQDLLNDPAIGVHHDPFAPSSIGTYEPNYVHNGFDSHNLADYQAHHANSFLDHQYSHVNHPSHLDHSFENQHLTDYQPHHANSLFDHQYSHTDHSSHSDHAFENQHLADYQPHHANSLLDHQYSHVNHPSHLDHLSQRSGSEKSSELLSQANGLEKQSNESLSSSQAHSKEADWHREHKNQSDAANHGKEAQNAMAESEKYQAEAQKLREQAKKV